MAGGFEKGQEVQQANPDPLGALIHSLDATDWKNTANGLPAQVDPFSTATEIVLHDIMPKSDPDPNSQSVVVIDKEHHTTHVLQVQSGQVKEVLAVPDTVGKPSTPTPNGRMVVTDKRLDPIWYPPKDIDPHQRPVPPYKVTHHNPIGLAFIRLNGSSIGMHGTNRPDQIGKSVSHGCIRHNNADIMKIYPLVHKGTAVYIEPRLEGTKVRTKDFVRS